MASSVEALAEAFEGTLRELRRLRRHLKEASKPSSTDLQIQFLKLPLKVPSRRASHRLPARWGPPLFEVRVVLPGGPVFGSFILSDVLKLCKLLCAQNVKVVATLHKHHSWQES